MTKTAKLWRETPYSTPNLRKTVGNPRQIRHGTKVTYNVCNGYPVLLLGYRCNGMSNLTSLARSTPRRESFWPCSKILVGDKKTFR